MSNICKEKKSICVNITLSSKFHTDNIVVVNLHKNTAQPENVLNDENSKLS